MSSYIRLLNSAFNQAEGWLSEEKYIAVRSVFRFSISVSIYFHSHVLQTCCVVCATELVDEKEVLVSTVIKG